MVYLSLIVQSIRVITTLWPFPDGEGQTKQCGEGDVRTFEGETSL